VTVERYIFLKHFSDGSNFLPDQTLSLQFMVWWIVPKVTVLGLKVAFQSILLKKQQLFHDRSN